MEPKDLQTNDVVPAILLRAMQHEKEAGREITAEKLKDAANQLRLIETGRHSALPLRCAGATCPMAWNCPLMKNSFTYMLSGPCPIEQEILKRRVEAYIMGLGVDVSNPIEVSMAQDLAEIDLFSNRAKDRLAYEDFITRQAIAVNEDGEVQYRSELSPAAIWDDMLFKRKMKLRDAFLATRKALAEAGGGQSSDPAQAMSKARALLERAKKNLERQDENLRAEAAKPANPVEDVPMTEVPPSKE